MSWSWLNFLASLTIGWGLLAFQGLCSYWGRFLTVSQMRSGGCKTGIPFLQHPAVRSDILLIVPLAAYNIARYGKQWSWMAIRNALIAAIVVTGIMTALYVRGSQTVPTWESHNGRLSLAGGGHGVFMACALTCLLLTYFATHQVPAWWAVTMSVLLFVHLFCAAVGPGWYVKGLGTDAMGLGVLTGGGIIVVVSCLYLVYWAR